MARIKSRRVFADITLSVVATINADVGIETFMRDNTDWLAEPKDASGCVMAVHFKSCTEKTAREIIVPSMNRKRMLTGG